MVDLDSNGRRAELEVTGQDMAAVLRIKMAQISELELQVMALTRMLADRDQRITDLEITKEPNLLAAEV